MSRFTPRRAPSLADATAELRDAALALDETLAEWWKHTPGEVGAAAVRLYHAKRGLRALITESVESRAS